MKFARLHFGKAAQHSIAGSTQGRWREGAQCRDISHRNSTNGGKRKSSERFKTSENQGKADAKPTDGDANYEIECGAQRILQEAQAIVARMELQKKLRQRFRNQGSIDITNENAMDKNIATEMFLRIRTQKRR